MAPKRFIGRDPEIDTLRRAMEDVVEGRGHVVLISGEPGIGKSRLVDELAAQATAMDLSVHEGRAWESGGAPALWPWVQILRACMSAPHAAAALTALGTSAEALKELVATAGRAGTAFAMSPESRFLIFDAVGRFLQHLATEKPLVLVFEDIHAVDESTLQMLEFVASSTSAARLLIIATYRHVEVQDRPAIDATVAALERVGERLHLQGLGAGESAELARQVDERLNDEVVREITEAAAGNPLFVTEVANLVRVEGAFRPEAIAGPAGEGLRRATRRRMQSLPSEVLEVLSRASVIGREVDVEILVSIAGSSEEAVRRSTARAEVEGLVSHSPTASQLTFAHEVIKQALYEDLSAGTRASLHLQIAEHLEEAHHRDPDRHADLIAHHYSRAGADVRARAVPYLHEAGDLAMSRFAYEGAQERFKEALSLVDPVDASLRCDLLIALGRAQIRGASGDERDSLFEAARVARDARDGDRMAEALVTLGEMKFLMPGMRDDEYLSALRSALHDVPPGDPCLRARLLATLSKELADDADRQQRREALDEALSIARSTGDLPTLAEVLVADMTRTLWEQAEDTLSICDELVSVGERLRDTSSASSRTRGREIALSALRRRSAALLEAGDLAGFERDAATIFREIGGLPQPRLRWMSECLHAAKAMVAGRFVEVEERAENVLQVMPNEFLSFAAWAMLRGASLLEQRRLNEMDDVLDQIVPAVPRVVGMRCYSAIAKAQAGRMDEARSTISPIFADLESVPRDAAWIVAMAMLAVVARELDDEEAARRLHEVLLPYRGKHAVVAMGQPTAYFGPIELHLGMAAAAAGMRDEAVDHLERACEEALRVGGAPWAARARGELALVLSGGDTAEKQRARALAAEAGEAADALSMIDLRDKLGFLLEEEDEPGGDTISIRREGDTWAIKRAGLAYSVRHGRGLDHLARLLTHPGAEIHTLELMTGGGASNSKAKTAAASEGLSTGGGETALLDDRAKKEFRMRVDELRSDLEEADANNDTERAARAREELDFIVAELERVTGLGGRTRSFAEPSEKARVSVTKAIGRTIDAIGKHDKPLAEYLRRSISTGLFCSYRPDTSHEAHGEVEVAT